MRRQHSLGLAPTDPPGGVGATTTWLTPKRMIDALGPFDLDPCAAPEPRPWPTAATHYALPKNDGLARDWFGHVWLNPPYTRHIWEWTERLAAHGDGIALVFARTDAKWFQDAVRAASCVRFLSSRVRFCDREGKPATGRPAIPSCLIAFGDRSFRRVMDATVQLPGLELFPVPVL